jgi:uncharacterized protein with FMN-binding domain
MRRAATIIGTTLGALVLLFNFETRAPAAGADNGLLAASSTPAASGPRPSTTLPLNRPTSTTTPPVTGAQPTTTVADSTTTTTQPTTTTTDAARVVDGPAVQTRYGTVQVEVTIQSGQLVDVEALTLPSGRDYTNYVSQVVGPMLRQEALAAQSGQISNISGATFTTRGYAQSLQSALDQAGF